MIVTRAHVAYFMKTNGACLDSVQWHAAQGAAEPPELWEKLGRPDWRVFVMRRLRVPGWRIRTYLAGVALAHAKHVSDWGLESFTTEQFVRILTTLTRETPGLTEVQALQLLLKKDSDWFGRDSFHFWMLSVMNRLICAIREEYGPVNVVPDGYYSVAAGALRDIQRLSPLAELPDPIKVGFTWEDLLPYIETSPMLPPTP